MPHVLSLIFLALLAVGVLVIMAVQNRRLSRQMQEASLYQRNLMRALVDSLPDMIYIKDAQGRYIIDNAAHAKMLGLPDPAAVEGKTPFDVFPRELADRYRQDDLKVMETGEAIIGKEEPVHLDDQETQWLRTTKIPFRDASGKVVGVVCLSQDLTAGRQGEQQRWELERFLNSIVENLPDMVFVKDAKDLRFVKMNRAGEELIGMPRASLIGKNDHDIFPKQEADFFTAKDRAVLESGRMTEIPAEEIQTSWGIRILHTKKIPLLSNDGKPLYMLGISHDITERRRAEAELQANQLRLEEAIQSERRVHEELRRTQAQMVQTEKLASLGELVAGVAHEINNPLAFVTNNVAVMQRDFSGMREILALYRGTDAILEKADSQALAPLRQAAERIDLEYVLSNLPELLARSREGLRRIQEIVRDLRDFARQDSTADLMDKVDLNPGIESTLNIARGRAHKVQIELTSDLAPLPGITCNAAKINQVVLNLVVNAIDACEAGGKVIVRTRPDKGGVAIEVSDTGKGIPAEIRHKIFDPFFTTKPQGKGTGLGLSISHGIILEHGGEIELESSMGKGSTFRVRLPGKDGGNSEF